MEQRLGEDIEDAMKAMTKNGIPRGVAKKALEIAKQKERFAIFALVDALTRALKRRIYRPFAAPVGAESVGESLVE